MEQRFTLHEIVFTSLLFHELCGGNGIFREGAGNRQLLIHCQPRGGFSTPVYKTGPVTDAGWNLQAQAGINLFGARAGLVGEFDYNHMGINSATLSQVGVPGGASNIWAFSAEPVIRLFPNNRVSFYAIGGPGVYHDNISYTAPVIAPVFSFFGPIGVPGNIVLASNTLYKPGVNGGAGVTFRLGQTEGKFFAEARYAQIYTRPVTSWVPVTFGFRW